MANSQNAPVWPGPRLLVPVALDVLLIGTPDHNADTTWASTHTSYLNLFKGLEPDAPAPFGVASAPAVGAHLMWTLPYALRHGQQLQSGEQAGDVDFPLVPNRWIVLRFEYEDGGQGDGSSGKPPVVTAGVIQSDLLSNIKVPPETVSQYPDPGDLSNPVKQIGGFTALEDWDGPAGPTKPFLKTTGPGEVSWAVAYDNVRNVFSFHDLLPNSKSATYTYMVMGWYADPTTDVLADFPASDPGEWLNNLHALGWGIDSTDEAQSAWTSWATARGIPSGPVAPDLPEQLKQAIEKWRNWRSQFGVDGSKPALPTQVFCHGMTATVEWKSANFAYGSGAPGGGTKLPTVALGNTATEAMSAFLAQKVFDEFGGDPESIPLIQQSLEAFQLGLLNDLVSQPVQTEARLHEARFNSARGGTEWIVVRPEAEGDQASEFGGQQTVPLDPRQTAALTDLNKTQRQQDGIANRVMSLQSELWALYFKQLNLGRNPPEDIKTKVDNSLAAVKSELSQLIQQRDQLTTVIQGKVQDLEDLLKGNDGKALFTVKSTDLPGFFAPNDPVVMVGGSNLDTKISRPGIYNDDEILFTRTTGQTITAITISFDIDGNDDPLAVGTADLLDNITLPLGEGIPKEFPDLALEALFLDTSNAGLLAKIYFDKRQVDPTPEQLEELTQQIQTQQTLPWNDLAIKGIFGAALSTISNFTGVLPSQAAVFFRKGQPWTPIFLDWRVSWFPSSETPAGSLDQWKLGDIDYAWEAPFNVPQPPQPLLFQGRSVLNPEVAQQIERQLATFSDNPDYADLPEFIREDLKHVAELIGNLDILTQSFGGFTRQLLTFIVAMGQEPENQEIRDLLENAPVTFRPVTGTINQTEAEPFFPLRSGHIQVMDVWVVDSYGQILRGKDPNLGPLNPIPNMIINESMVTPGGDKNKTYAQLPPRIGQDARAELRLLQADNDDIPSNSSDLTSPICGWVMVNHLDDSLMVFDAAGINQGSVLTVERDAASEDQPTTGLRWDAVPGSDAPLGSPPDLENTHLQAFVSQLLDLGLQGTGAFDDFLNAIDSTLWVVNPFAAQEGNLSVLVGRPLAVVRAEVDLELDGLPAYNQSWIDTGKYYLGAGGGFDPTPPPFLNVPFNIRVGDLAYETNGVLGYFQDDQYEKFFAVYGSSLFTGNLRAALKLSSPKARAALAEMATGEAPPLAGSSPSGYVEFGHLIQQKPQAASTVLTILMDPRGSLPVVTGSLPESAVSLAPGPVTEALRAMALNFRTGPILTDPNRIRMPLPSEIQGNWTWQARSSVTSWGDPAEIEDQNAIAKLETNPLILDEGWLILKGSQKQET